MLILQIKGEDMRGTLTQQRGMRCVFFGGLSSQRRISNMGCPLSNHGAHSQRRSLFCGPCPLRVDVPAAEAQELLKSLTPFDVVTTPERSGAYDYLFVHQAGRDPLVFRVKLAGDQLIFSERRSVYQGANSQQFRQIAEEILRSDERSRR